MLSSMSAFGYGKSITIVLAGAVRAMLLRPSLRRRVVDSSLVPNAERSSLFPKRTVGGEKSGDPTTGALACARNVLDSPWSVWMSGVLNHESAMADLASARRRAPDRRGCVLSEQQAQASQLTRRRNGRRRPGIETPALRRNATSGLNRCPLKRCGMSRPDHHVSRSMRVEPIATLRSSIFAGANSCSMGELHDMRWQRDAASEKLNPRERNPCR